MLARSPISAWHTPAQWLLIGWQEIGVGLANWRIAHLMGIGELRRRYARSRLGQFWLVASTGVMILILGVVWSILWRAPVAQMMPYIATGLVLWSLITGTLGEAPMALASAAPLFLNQGTSFATVIFALVYRQVLIFMHNATLVVLTLLVFRRYPGPVAMLALPGCLLLIINIVWPSYVIALACSRFRDLTSVVANLLVIAFFVTPVFFEEAQVPPQAHWIIDLNPLAVLLSIVRDPILGRGPPASAWAASVFLAIVGSFATMLVIGKYRRRIIYWL